MFYSIYRQVHASAGPIPREIFCIEIIFGTHNNINDINLLLAFKAMVDSDTLYYY